MKCQDEPLIAKTICTHVLYNVLKYYPYSFISEPKQHSGYFLLTPDLGLQYSTLPAICQVRNGPVIKLLFYHNLSTLDFCKQGSIFLSKI